MNVYIPSNANNKAVLPDPVGPMTRLTLPCSNVTSSIRSRKERVVGIASGDSRPCSDHAKVVSRMPMTSSRVATWGCSESDVANSSMSSVYFIAYSKDRKCRRHDDRTCCKNSDIRSRETFAEYSRNWSTFGNGKAYNVLVHTLYHIGEEAHTCVDVCTQRVKYCRT